MSVHTLSRPLTCENTWFSTSSLSISRALNSSENSTRHEDGPFDEMVQRDTSREKDGALMAMDWTDSGGASMTRLVYRSVNIWEEEEMGDEMESI